MQTDSTLEWIRQLVAPDTGILREIRAMAEPAFVPIALPETAALLRVLVRSLRPVRVLEVGTAVGYSAILMAMELPETGRVDTIERDADRADIAREHIRKAGMGQQIQLIEEDAAIALPMLGGPYDLIFLDAAKGQYLEFLPQLMRLLRPGGMLISDNVLYRGDVASEELPERKHRTMILKLREYLDVLCRNPELDTAVLPLGDGVALSCRKEAGA